jgi:threonine dehydrogenase-like Zn-dependent dehydrogenase
MKALGITPRQAHTARLVDLPMPSLDEIPDGRGVLVKVLQVGVDGTDKELHLDLIFEATGFSPMVFKAARILAKNGILVLASITGGDHKTEVESDRLNLDFVLGNKVIFGTVNAHRGYFEQGVSDFALAEVAYPGWLSKQLTHPVKGLENYAELLRILFKEKEAIKAYLIIGEDD